MGGALVHYKPESQHARSLVGFTTRRQYRIKTCVSLAGELFLSAQVVATQQLAAEPEPRRARQSAAGPATPACGTPPIEARASTSASAAAANDSSAEPMEPALRARTHSVGMPSSGASSTAPALARSPTSAATTQQAHGDGAQAEAQADAEMHCDSDEESLLGDREVNFSVRLLTVC